MLRSLQRASQVSSKQASKSWARLQTTTAVPVTPLAPRVQRPIGAFRGGITGFLLGFASAGVASYVYLSNEFQKSSELLFVDIESVHSSVRRLEEHIATLEAKR